MGGGETWKAENQTNKQTIKKTQNNPTLTAVQTIWSGKEEQIKKMFV